MGYILLLLVCYCFYIKSSSWAIQILHSQMRVQQRYIITSTLIFEIFGVNLEVRCHWMYLNKTQPETNWDRSQSNCVSANPGNVVLARPRTFVGSVFLLPSNVKTLVAGFAFFFMEKRLQHSNLILFKIINIFGLYIYSKWISK